MIKVKELDYNHSSSQGMLWKKRLVRKAQKTFLRFMSLGRVDIAPGEAEEKVILKSLLAD
jgi:hypothetical protein